MFDKEKILRKLGDELNQNEVEAFFLPGNETGLDTDILATRHRGFGSMSNTAEGEFAFLDGGEGDFTVFNCRIGIVSDISDRDLELVSAEMMEINAALPLGSFAYDPYDGTVFYSLRAPFVYSMKEKEALEEADSMIALSMSAAERYCSTILKLAGKGAETL